MTVNNYYGYVKIKLCVSWKNLETKFKFSKIASIVSEPATWLAT